MSNQDFTTTFSVDRTPEQVFNAITNVRGWWSEEVEGGTTRLNDEFNYHYRDVHTCRIKLTEVIPNQRIVWLVTDNYFNFAKDNSEWKNTRIIFDITENHGKTHLHFTHEGLVPAYECYNICRDAWTQYLQESLYQLITTGKGQPNSKEGGLHYSDTFLFDRTAEQVFNAINDVRAWWSDDFEGASQQINDVFSVNFGDVHYSEQKVTEMVPNEKVVWLVTGSKLNFLKDKSEWTGTSIVFEISRKDGGTQLRFTHQGLVPELECFGDCSNGWNYYLQSLVQLITTGKGHPNLKEATA